MNILFTWLGQTDVENMPLDKHAAISQIAIKHSNPFDKILILSSAWFGNVRELWKSSKP